MTIYRGPGGGGNADSDAEINQLAAFALDAENSAIAAAASAVQAAESADASAAAVDASIAAGVSAADALSSANDAADSAILAVDAKDAAEAAQLAAESSATAAASSATDAVEAAALAFSSENAADTAAENATASAVSAASSASTATTQAGLASTSASNAATSASGASTSASNAASSASSAAASYDSFDDRYLGAKSANPTLDNDGNALLTGALYWNTAANEMRVYSGSAWIVSYLPADGYVQKSGDTMTGALIISNVDVLNASYDSVSFSVAAQEAIPTAVFFSADGSKMFVIGSNGDDVNEYVLSTPWVVSSATYSTVFLISGQETAPSGLFFRADGLKMYVVGTTNDTVYQYALTSPWSVATASYESISFSVAAQDITPSGVFFKPNGLSMYVCGSANDSVYQYTLSTAWDVSTATYLQTFSVLSQETAPQDLSFTGDGTRMFVIGSSGDDVNVYNLTTPWDIGTAANTGAFSVAAEDTSPVGLYIKPDGTKMYVVGQVNDTVFQYSVPSVEIQLTGTTAINGSATVAQDLTVNGNINGPTTLVANSTGTALRITQTGTGNALLVEDSNPDSTPFVVDVNGKAVVGNTAAIATTESVTAQLQVHATNSAGAQSINIWGAAVPQLQINRAGSGGIGTYTALSSGNTIGKVTFGAADGTAFVRAAEIVSEVDGTPGTDDMPGRLVFSTTADGASTPTERMRISATGQTTFTIEDMTAANPAAFQVNSTAKAGQTGNMTGVISTLNTSAAYTGAGSVIGFYANEGTFTVAPTNQYGFYYAATNNSATNNYAFWGGMAAGTGRYNFYASGTADNYFAGNVGIGTAAPLTALNVNGTGGELLRLSVTPDGGVIQEPAIGFATGVTNTHPAAKISALEFDASDSRASLLFYTRDSNSDVAPTERMRIDSSGNLLFNSGYGSAATAYGCRAWVNFNGTGTVAIRASGNVSSITDNGTGDYTVNFTTAMPDANYALVGTVQQGTALVVVGVDGPSSGGTATLYTTTQARIQCYSSGGSIDPAIVNISVSR